MKRYAVLLSLGEYLVWSTDTPVMLSTTFSKIKSRPCTVIFYVLMLEWCLYSSLLLWRFNHVDVLVSSKKKKTHFFFWPTPGWSGNKWRDSENGSCPWHWHSLHHNLSSHHSLSEMSVWFSERWPYGPACFFFLSLWSCTRLSFTAMKYSSKTSGLTWTVCSSCRVEELANVLNVKLKS